MLYFEVELRAPWESSTAEGQQRNRAQRLLKKKTFKEKKAGNEEPACRWASNAGFDQSQLTAQVPMLVGESMRNHFLSAFAFMPVDINTTQK